MDKIKRKILKKDTDILPFETSRGKEAIPFNYEIEELKCPICKKKWLKFSINDYVLYGGEASASTPEGFKEGCIDCILKEIKREVQTSG